MASLPKKKRRRSLPSSLSGKVTKKTCRYISLLCVLLYSVFTQQYHALKWRLEMMRVGEKLKKLEPKKEFLRHNFFLACHVKDDDDDDNNNNSTKTKKKET